MSSNNSRELELYTMRTLLKSEPGRAFMFRCLQNCCTFETIFNVDATLHSFNSGKREHGLWLAEELREAEPDYYFKMLRENIT